MDKTCIFPCLGQIPHLVSDVKTHQPSPGETWAHSQRERGSWAKCIDCCGMSYLHLLPDKQILPNDYSSLHFCVKLLRTIVNNASLVARIAYKCLGQDWSQLILQKGMSANTHTACVQHNMACGERIWDRQHTMKVLVATRTVMSLAHTRQEPNKLFTWNYTWYAFLRLVIHWGQANMDHPDHSDD